MRVIVFVLIPLLLLVTVGKGSPKTDSLRAVLKTRKQTDTVKALLYLQLGNEYELSDGDSVLKYGNLAYEVSLRTRFKRGAINALEVLGAGHQVKGRYDSALHYYSRSLASAKDTKLVQSYASKYNHIGNVYFLTGRYSDAKIYYDSVVHTATQYKDDILRAKGLSNIANVYYKMGDYATALKYYLHGLEIQEQLGIPENMASDLSNIANVYYRLGRYNMAKSYTDRAMALHRKSDNKERIIGSLTTYAMIYNDKKQYDSSLLYLSEAMQLASEMQSPYLENILKGNIAECYLKKGDYERAEKLYSESLNMSGKLGDAEGVAFAKAGLGDVFINTGATSKGNQYLREALAEMKQLGIKEQVVSIAKKLSESYERVGDNKNALFFYKLQVSVEDSLKKQHTREEAAQMTFNYDLSKKESQIKLLEKDRSIIASKNQNQKIIVWASLAGILLLSVVAYLSYRNWKNEKHSTFLILGQNEALEQQSLRLSELNDFKNVVFSVLAHDLRGPVSGLTTTMEMLDADVMTTEEFLSYRHELKNRLQPVNMLLENLLYWAKSQMQGESAPQIERLNIRRKVLRAISVLGDSAHGKHIDIDNMVPDNVWAFADRDHVDIAMRNIISNAIKFTPPGGRVSLSSSINGNMLQINIADNGVGMSQDTIANLFTKTGLVSMPGTAGEKGTGIGLRLCYDLIRKNNGDIKVSSTPGKGTTFVIELPVA
ncbi:tetratricopeptide repeat-containing sensor histidine kinase [Polluticoccus soli]|uniref:tetratricopeptide repeat-containing sensor histidine kinase n=1 Tax=Polluticoccus soli TaxID=3034150 RepID=UPI0023E0CBB6|nr:tetratricopeptide repeat-containing sensor histidine kinase [Flavipsychrobacter sp. JY13-12]